MVLIAVFAKKVSQGMDVRVQVDQLLRRTVESRMSVKRLIMPDFFLVIVDIDECTYGIHKCDANAYCTNAFGSHNCSCKEGFTGDGHSCSGILH